MMLNQAEQRNEPRIDSTSPIWYRGMSDRDFRIGWMLECSDSGVAFLIRGEDPPELGATMSYSVGPPGETTTVATVRRVNNVHRDVYVVAAQAA